MHGKGQVVEAHRRQRRQRVAHRKLVADQVRVEEARGRDGVAEEAQDVDDGEVDGEPDGGSTSPVEQRLRVEGCAPAEEAAMGRL